MAKLMGATGVTDHRRIHAIVESNGLISSLGKLNAGSKLMTRAFKSKACHMELMGSIPKTVCPQITSGSTKQLGEPSAKPAPTPSVLGGPNEESVDQEPAEIVDDNAASDDAGTETPPVVPGRRTVSLSANPIHEGWSERHS